MMRKAKWKRVVAAGAILMSLGMVFPSADIQAEDIKVLKRIGYGYRNMDYFFTLIRFHSLPKNYSSPKFP